MRTCVGWGQSTIGGTILIPVITTTHWCHMYPHILGMGKTKHRVGRHRVRNGEKASRGGEEGWEKAVVQATKTWAHTANVTYCDLEHVTSPPRPNTLTGNTPPTVSGQRTEGEGSGSFGF